MLLLFVAMWATYSNSFHNAFHFDDFHTITDNPAVRSLANVPRFFTDATTFSVLGANQTYRPVVSSSLALDYALGQGYVPFWFHLSTFLWFLVLLGLLVPMYETIFDRTDPAGGGTSRRNTLLALVTAAWFGLHPAMAETVNYIIQRGDLFCTLGCVASLAIFMRYPRARKTGLYLLPFAIALLSKPPAAVYPALLFCYVSLFEAEEGRARWKTSLVAALPALAVTGALLWLQSAMTPKSFAPSILSSAAYRLTQPFVWMRYAGELVLPLHLNVDSDLAPFATWNGRAVLGLVFVAALLAAIGWSLRQRSRYPIAFGLIWFVVTQLPTSAYALSEVENDHRMFFSFPGLMLAAGWAAWLVVERLVAREVRNRWWPALSAVVVLVLCAYAWGAHERNRVWLSEDSLWLDDVQKSPHNGRGLMIYGLTRMNRGDDAEALGYYERALAFTPNYASLEINLGVVHGLLHHAAEAEQHLLRAIALAPNDDQPHAFYGRWLLGQGHLQEAIAQERIAIALDPQRSLERDVLLDALERLGNGAVLRQAAEETLAAIPGDATAQTMLTPHRIPAAIEATNLSLAEYRQGRYREAIVAAEKATSLDPGLAEAYNNLGAAHGALGEWDAAIANEDKALQLDPGMQLAKNNMALFTEKKRSGGQASQPSAVEWIARSLALNQAGKFEESIAAAKASLALQPANAAAWNNIAADNEAMHRWDAAIVAARKALQIQPDFELARNNLKWAESQKALGER